MKKNVMIRIDENLLHEAKEYGLNISKVSENALKDMIDRLEGSNSRERPKSSSESAKKSRLVARERFGLSSAGPKPAMLGRYTTGLLVSRQA